MVEPAVACLDIETTGLDPNKGAILEIAIVLADKSFAPIKSFQSLVRPPEGWWDLVDEKAVSMHSENGLWDAISSEYLTLDTPSEVARKAKQFLLDSGVEGGQLPMTGSSIHFDRSWLATHMPKLHSMFHYRNLDISSIKEFLKVVAPDLVYPKSTEPKAHRALDDVMETLIEASHYSRLFTAVHGSGDPQLDWRDVLGRRS